MSIDKHVMMYLCFLLSMGGSQRFLFEPLTGETVPSGQEESPILDVRIKPRKVASAIAVSGG